MKRILLSLFSAAALLFAGVTPVLVPIAAQAQVATDAGKTGIARPEHLLCSGHTALSVTGTLTETALATCTVPAGAMGLNGGLHFYTTWTITNSANTKTMRVRLGGIGGTAHMAVPVTTSATLHDFRRIRNRNSATSQVGGTSAAAGSAFTTSGIAVITSAIDTAATQDLVLSGQLTNTGETITLESYEIWLVP